MNFNDIKINRTIDELINDIKNSDDLIHKTILQKFLDIKLKQIKNSNLSSNLKITNQNKVVDKELKGILKLQTSSLEELEKIHRINAYQQLLEDNKKSDDQEFLQKKRGGTTEKYWGTDKLYDPKYVKYMKEDTMNNKMMERLNSEIDFRLNEESSKMNMEKPFDEVSQYDTMDMFARFDDNTKEMKYIPKTKNNIKKYNTY